MAYRKFVHILILFLFVTVILTLSSCEKFSGDQAIPAYLSIDTISLTTDYSSQGTTSQSITDAWVYVDGDLVGTFQLPARFPVLHQGINKVTIIAGIKKDGIASTRMEYPFYNIIEKSIRFTPDSTSSIKNLKTTYKANTQFLWMEDFDNNAAISLDTTKRSSVKMKKTVLLSDSVFEGSHSGKVELLTDSSYFEELSHSGYLISTSTQTFLELNFRTNITLTVGVYLYSSSTIYDVPIMSLFPTNEKWKKVYIDLSTSINAYSGMSTFRVYFSASKDATVSKGYILLDNCKLITQ